MGAGLREPATLGHHPAAFVRLKLSPGEVDVNVHPAKSTVRLRGQRSAYPLVVGTIRAAKHSSNWKELGEVRCLACDLLETTIDGVVFATTTRRHLQGIAQLLQCYLRVAGRKGCQAERPHEADLDGKAHSSDHGANRRLEEQK